MLSSFLRVFFMSWEYFTMFLIGVRRMIFLWIYTAMVEEQARRIAEMEITNQQRNEIEMTERQENIQAALAAMDQEKAERIAADQVSFTVFLDDCIP